MLTLLILFAPNAALAAVPDVYLGGQSIGVMLHTEGVSIVGLSPVVLSDGRQVNPAAEAGLEIGDFIISINDVTVNSNHDVMTVVEDAAKAGKNCQICYLRNNLRRQTEVSPCFCTDSNSYRIGLYVRDNTAGIGTLTFWEPDSSIYGALGHNINTNSSKEASGGMITLALIQGIRAGKAGAPGEKLGTFAMDGWQGSIVNNGNYGIYGLVSSLPGNPGPLLQIAQTDQVEEGAATLYTVINGQDVEAFEVQVRYAGNELNLSNRGLIVEVTDERLLQETGGIVQGMSGSPLVQNGRLIAAISHVFINDPTKGYACYALQMAEEAGLNTR